MKYHYTPLLLIRTIENITHKTKRYELFTQHKKKTQQNILNKTSKTHSDRSRCS